MSNVILVLILLVVLGCSSVALAQTKQKIMKIYISPDHPELYTEESWRICVRSAMNEWYGRIGYKVVVVKDWKQADIYFGTNLLGNIDGMVHPHPYPPFPHFPRNGEQVRVTISIHTKRLYQVLLHEVGHTLGIPHRSESIMQVESPRPRGLTPKDLSTIEFLREQAK